MKKLQSIFAEEDELERSGLDLLRNFSQPTTFVSGVLLLLVVLCAIFAPLIAPTDPYDLSVVSILDGRLAPGEQMFDGTVAWLGTDGAGRDVLSAILFVGMEVQLILKSLFHRLIFYNFSP